jgi:DNA (cytosine-5)-methyltransferase 1
VALVLSLFPGIGLLDMAFEEEGFTVVRGPDVLWGGDIRSFHPPAGVFDGVIGGPPCQTFSRLAILQRSNGHEPRFGNLIPEFERCVAEAAPAWFIMENVPDAPRPEIASYRVSTHKLNNRYFGAEQNRVRNISFGTQDGRSLVVDVALFEAPYTRGRFSVTARHSGRLSWVPKAVTAGHGGAPKRDIFVYSLEDSCELQGLPRDFTEHMPFTKQAKLKAVANGVPLPMGRAIARAVKRAVYQI